MIRVDSQRAFLAAWLRGEACSWCDPVGHELRFYTQSGPTLQLLPAPFSSFRLREALMRRFLAPGRYEGCYLSATPEGAPLLMLQLTGSEVPQDAIGTLYSLADMA
ncbi:hypothetical protein [Erwinia sp. 198]|uniref:hypothetical protein n=1 Tax=Erwinia sp. 198 TaxID=2022746 RepID=UPI000F67C352|nr:hypothetical protein [Erwinia sp. 198]RRZ93719.1 hypothetical protein EGK14_07960 [Erwinia sp. 198]